MSALSTFHFRRYQWPQMSPLPHGHVTGQLPFSFQKFREMEKREQDLTGVREAVVGHLLGVWVSSMLPAPGLQCTVQSQPGESPHHLSSGPARGISLTARHCALREDSPVAKVASGPEITLEIRRVRKLSEVEGSH